MGTAKPREPLYRGIMLSSTFRDLEKHRTSARDIIGRAGFKDVCMENDGALTIDVLESSIDMVRGASAYICIIGLRYGQILNDETRNPDGRSVTELEFEEAQRRGLPILLYVMSEAHPITRGDHVSDEEERARNAFAERAKRIQGQEPQRVYCSFDDVESFAQRLAGDLGKLSRALDPRADMDDMGDTSAEPVSSTRHPAPPERAACPSYIGSHDFVGRKSELDDLDDWADPAGQHPLYVLRAIGGSGKSYLTWHWMETHAQMAAEASGEPWAGRFWYSFYEAGATMLDMCRQALAYIEGQPRDAFDKMKALQAETRLIRHLETGRWLLVLDGLERVLVEYNRSDAPRMDDAEADARGQRAPDRNACETIRPADGDFLLRLSQAQPSRILVTTRLVPACLLNPSEQPKPGVKVDYLSGLRGEDAEAMMQANGAQGDSRKLRSYLKTNCDNHPLTMGVLAGLIALYPPRPGDFDTWVADPDAGGGLKLGALDLKQRRNHILRIGLDALDRDSRALLGTLSFLYAGADYETLMAVNPKGPQPPKAIPDPGPAPDDDTPYLRDQFQKNRDAFLAYQDALAAWQRDPALRDTKLWLQTAIIDLRKRGFLQYEPGSGRYDLHPVVRSVVSADFTGAEHEAAGQRVVDHFSAAQHLPYEEAETLADLTVGLELMRSLLRLERFEAAMTSYRQGLSRALYYNLRARDEMRALLRPFFPDGWGNEPVELPTHLKLALLNEASIAQDDYGIAFRSLLARQLACALEQENALFVLATIFGLVWDAEGSNRIAEADRWATLYPRLCAGEVDRKSATFLRFVLSATSHWQDVEQLGKTVSAFTPEKMGMRFSKASAMSWYAFALLRAGRLTDEEIDDAERWAKTEKSRLARETALMVRAWHRLETDGPSGALPHFDAALTLLRERGEFNYTFEADYLRARRLAGQVVERGEVERLSAAPDSAALEIAQLWEVLDDPEKAVHWAVRAHAWAVADGEPYVRRWELERARSLLDRLGQPLPEVPTYDPSQHQPAPWEAEVEAFAERFEARRAEEEALRQAVRDHDVDRVRALSRQGVSMFAQGEDGQDAVGLVGRLEGEGHPLAKELRAALRDRPEDARC